MFDVIYSLLLLHIKNYTFNFLKLWILIVTHILWTYELYFIWDMVQWSISHFDSQCYCQLSIYECQFMNIIHPDPSRYCDNLLLFTVFAWHKYDAGKGNWIFTLLSGLQTITTTRTSTTFKTDNLPRYQG